MRLDAAGRRVSHWWCIMGYVTVPVIGRIEEHCPFSDVGLWYFHAQRTQCVMYGGAHTSIVP